MQEKTIQKNTAIQAMTAKELAQIVVSGQELFILDVRNETDFAAWKMEGKGIQLLNIPYFDLLDGVDEAMIQIPAEGPLLVVCAKEGSSRMVGEQIAEAGRGQVYYLEGGMKSWSEHLEPVKVGDLSDGGSIYQFVRLGKGCLSYMIVSGDEAAVVDTLRMTEVFEQFAKEQGVRITHTIDTHLHADHISGGRVLAEQSGATYWLPSKDATDVAFHYEALEEGRMITVGQTTINIEPVYSPGHTIGSTSLIIDDQYMLTGDILFVESIGRPDLAGLAEDWVGDLRNTLYKRYKELPQHLIILPAHFGKVSELGEGGRVCARLSDVMRTNPGLHMQNETEFRQAVTTHLPPQPNEYQKIREVNMGKRTPDHEEQRAMEIGPNRCAIHD